MFSINQRLAPNLSPTVTN